MRTRALFALSILTLAGCSKVDGAINDTSAMNKNLSSMKSTTEGMSGTTNGMKSGLDDATRNGKLGSGKDDLDLSKHNYTFYLPPPSEILLGAQLVAENMNEKELLDYLFTRIKEMNESNPDGRLQDMRKYPVGGFAVDYVNSFNTQQMVRGIILQAIAGQIPQPMVEKLVQHQIFEGGSRNDVVYQMLMLRATFLNEFLLAKDAFREKLHTIGDVRVARERIGYLKYITGQPFAAQIKFKVESSQFLPDVISQSIFQGDANYQDACVNVTPDKPADPGCATHLSDYIGVTTYNMKLDTAMDQPHWAHLAHAITGYTECDGTAHKAELPATMIQSNSSYAHELAEMEAEALRNFTPEVCAKQ